MKNHKFYFLGITLGLLVLFTNCKEGSFSSNNLVSISSGENKTSTTAITTLTQQTQTSEGTHGQCGQNTYACLNGTTLSNNREEDGSYKWSCLGLNGGEDVRTCSLSYCTIISRIRQWTV